MRKTLGVCLLVLLLTGSAGAGVIPNDTPAPPPPPQPATSVQEPTDGTTLNGDTQFPGASDILTETALDLLAVLL
jgi:hypothetical protein